MGIFKYGRVYSRLPEDKIKDLKFGVTKNKTILSLARIYFWLFGYPDIASQRRYVMVEKSLLLKNGDSVLDAGCGNGIYLQEFGNRYGTEGYGIDVRRERIESAKRINKGLGRNDIFIASPLEKVNLGVRKFHKAICLEVLEHIVDDSGVLKSLSRNLVKGGIFIVSIPMKGTALTKEQEDDPHFKPEKYEHVRSGYTRRDIHNMATKAGLKVRSIEEYFFVTSRLMVKLQQYIYKKNWVVLNLALSPLLNIISLLDNFIQVNPRGYLIILVKK